jgi:MtrB/PioB family decaheme-associated outer membrane protein
MSLLRGLIVLVVATFVVAEAAAQEPRYSLLGMNLEGEIETGVRFFLEEPSKVRSAKFQEYRDIDDGLFLGRFYLRAFKPDESYSTEFEGSKWGNEDQFFALRAGRLGVWEAGFEWDQMRRVLYTNARLLANENDRGVFILPPPLAGADLSRHNAANEHEISVRWDTARLNFRLTPTPNTEIKAQYSRIRKEGDKELGVVFGSPGANFYQVLEPIEQTIHEFRLTGVYAADIWQLQFGYVMSLFQNDERRVLADNPCFGNGPPDCSAGDAGGPPRGQVSLPPSNIAHTFTLGGGVTLPMRSRIHGNFAYSMRLQNESFLPHTVNPTIDGDPDLRLPQDSLHGFTQIINVNLVGTTRPWDPVTFTGKYRLYMQLDYTDRPAFNAQVVGDRSITRETTRAARLDYNRHNVDLDTRLTFWQPVAITVGPGWERWDRSEGREVRESDEFFFKLAADATPADWLTARLTYKPSYRRLAHYNPRARAESLVVEDVAAEVSGQSVFLRKFDEAERDRQRVDVSLTFAPSEKLTITPMFGYRYDDYIESRLGLQREESWSAGMDVTVTPNEWISLSAGYTYEQMNQLQRNRQRPSLAGGATGDFKDYEWVSNNVDTVQTAHATLRGTILPRKLEWSLGALWSYALGTMDTNNPVDPQSDTAANNATARAKPFPAFEDQLFRVDAALKYHFNSSWTAALGYAWESFSKHDWRTDALNPFVPVPSTAGLAGQSSIWLGADLKNYSAHIIGATLTYRFK